MSDSLGPIKVGDKVDILEQGKWVGPFKVQAIGGRTLDHIILAGPNGGFEMYNDYPYNVRRHVYDQHSPTGKGLGIKGRPYRD